MFPVQQATITAGPVDLWVDAATGSDDNDGTEDRPFATLIQAEAVLPDIIGRTAADYVRIFVAAGTYVAPTFRKRALRAGIYIICEEFTTLVGSTATTAGAQTSVTCAGGLGVDTYRGKTIEILTGAAAGDRRNIRDHTDAVITPTIAFSAAVGIGATFRIVEPLAQLDPPPGADTAYLADGDGASWGLNDAYGAKGPAQSAVTYINFLTNLSSVRLNAPVRFYGCETLAGMSLEGSGVLWVGWDGNDRSDFDDQAAGTGLLFGAPTDTSWAGWGIATRGTCIFSGLDVSILSVVTGLGGTNGVIGAFSSTQLSVQGGSVASTGANGGVFAFHAAVDSPERPTIVQISGKTLFPDIPFLITATAGPGAQSSGKLCKLILHRVTMTATGFDGVLAQKSGYVSVADDVIIVDSTTGLRARSGGRIDFMGGANVTATGNEIEVGNLPATSTIAALANNLDFVVDAPSDGSVVQRIDLI